MGTTVLKIIFLSIFIYVAVLGLSCNMWDLSLWLTDFSLVVMRGTVLRYSIPVRNAQWVIETEGIKQILVSRVYHSD